MASEKQRRAHISKVRAAAGRKGGLARAQKDPAGLARAGRKGGKARALKLSKRRRVEIARLGGKSGGVSRPKKRA